MKRQRCYVHIPAVSLSVLLLIASIAPSAMASKVKILARSIHAIFKAGNKQPTVKAVVNYDTRRSAKHITNDSGDLETKSNGSTDDKIERAHQVLVDFVVKNHKSTEVRVTDGVEEQLLELGAFPTEGDEIVVYAGPPRNVANTQLPHHIWTHNLDGFQLNHAYDR